MTTNRPMEVKKDGLRQMQDGCWKLTVTVHPNDMPTSLMTAPMGTRYGMALVEIGDDERPLGDNDAVEASQEPTEAKKPRVERTRSQMAAIRCGDNEWCRWNSLPDLWDSEQVADWLRQQLGVRSRKELDTDPVKAAMWDRINSQFKQATGRAAEQTR